jgi:3-dehydroquinate synthase
MTHNNNIHIGNNILSVLKNIEIVQMASSIVIVTDDNVEKHWLTPVQTILSNKKIITICIKHGEANKTIKTLEFIWKKMLKGGVDRSSVVVTLGGGVVGDIGGFAAATFMRGIPVVHIPTTLLAQVDAGVGGKTAIDFCGIKNSIGVFHQPSAVVIDVQMLSTLPHRQLVSGFAEIIKHAIIADKDFFILLSKKKISEIKNNEWMHIISKSIEIKTNIVEQDENEKNGIRKQLNFGHTIGHAVEALSLKTNHPLLHGEAVAIGMMAEARMSRLAGLLSKKEEELIISVLWHLENLKHISGISFSQIHHIIKTDKKNKKEILLWSLPIAIGKVQSDLILTGEVVKKGILSITE